MIVANPIIQTAKTPSLVQETRDDSQIHSFKRLSSFLFGEQAPQHLSHKGLGQCVLELYLLRDLIF